jgi:hypothetical protein
MRPGKDRGLSRRDFVAAAVAIGGSSALSACLGIEGSTETETAAPTETATPTESAAMDFPSGAAPSALPASQHVWNQYLVHDAHGNTNIPQHQLVLGLSYEGSIPPTAEERAQVEGAMATLDRAFQWGTGGDPAASLNQGLLTMLGYAPTYFDRMDATVEGLTPPAEVLEAVGEDPAKADPFDAMLVLNSDFGSILLAAEAALFGEREELNGQAVADTFEGVFSTAGRRAGIVGRGHPAEKLDREDIPDEAPLSMGFRSGFADNQASEERVTIDSGPFAGGTTLAASRLRINLDRWYDNDADERVERMFSPRFDEEALSETGDRLGSESEVTEEDANSIEETGDRYHTVGHTQKVAAARDEDFEPTILRLTEAVATDDDFSAGTAFNFNSIQDDVQEFVAVRKAMTPEQYDTDVENPHHGIVDYLETRARGAYLVPPRDQRALPTV